MGSLADRIGRAERALGRLDEAGRLLPDKKLFLYMYVRKEAVLSSQIEGTQSTLNDLLQFEVAAAAGRPVDDIREVSNYVDALMYGLERIATLPVSLRLLRELHGRLLDSGRGAKHGPGEFRRSQNWIGGTRPGNAIFVPPPPAEMMVSLGELENFIHEDGRGIPPLIKAGLVHVQFETIHPFLDGNGRLGRLLTTLLLCAQGVLDQPLLYLSLYLKQHRPDYYRLLQEVRERGAWEAWLEFYLDGVIATAEQALDSATRISGLLAEDRARLEAQPGRGTSLLALHELAKTMPYFSAQTVAAKTGLTMPTVNAAIRKLATLGIIEETTGKRRGRIFAYRAYLALLNEGVPSV